MSHNTDPHTAAKNHRPAIIGIALALMVALVVFLVFRPGINEQNQGIATTPPPSGTINETVSGTPEAIGAAREPASTPAPGGPIPIPAPIAEPDQRPIGGPIQQPAPAPSN